MMESFDDYCERKGIKPGEEPVAFAAYLAENGAPDVSGPHPICSCENDPDVCAVHGTRAERAQGHLNPVYFTDPRGGSFVLDENGDPIAPARGCLIGILIGVVLWAIIVLILWKAGVW